MLRKALKGWSFKDITLGEDSLIQFKYLILKYPQLQFARIE